MSITAIMPSRDGIVAEYLFSGNTQDTSGYGNHATNSGATLAVDKYGRANEAYSFDGINDFMTINHNANYDFGTNPYTIVMAIKTGDTLPASTMGLYHKYVDSNNLILLALFSNSTFIYDVRVANVTQRLLCSHSIAINTNYFITVIVDFVGGNKIYIDNIGKTLSTNTLTSHSSSNNGNIELFRNRSGASFTKGSTDTLKLFNRALSPNEITKLYNYWLSH